MMTIEILFPEFCNLFGDMSNMRYLQKCLPEARFVETPLEGEPLFLTEEVSLLYLGPMTERTQERVIAKLRPAKERLRKMIDGGTVFLFTGNAMEVLGEYILKEDGGRIEGLGLLPLYAKRNMMARHNSTFLGEFRGGEIMGFKSQFTMAYPTAGVTAGETGQDGRLRGLFPVKKGVGLYKKCPFEGVREKNFFGTYLLGPVLLLNPEFTRYLLTCMGAEDPRLAFEEEMQAAYEKRLKDFHDKT